MWKLLLLVKQEVANQLAKQCIIACARLAGYHSGEKDEGAPPDNPTVKKSLMAMLTPYLARKLANPDPSEVILFFSYCGEPHKLLCFEK